MSTKKELIKRCEELGIDTKPLTTNALLEEAIKAAEAKAAVEGPAETDQVTTETSEAPEVKTAEASVDPKEEPAESAEETPKENSDASETTSELEPPEEEETEEDEPEDPSKEESAAPSYEDDRGRKWKFKSSAPKTLNIDGHPMTQQEILDTEEVVSELVHGNSAHLTQILD